MRSALEGVSGVESVEVDYTSKTAHVQCNGECDERALLAALEKAGYSAKVH